jgi:SsrA-binding protein
LPRGTARAFASRSPLASLVAAAGIPGSRLRIPPPMSIVDNRKAYHDYFIEEKFEAGLSLEGWEVKAIRAGRAQLKEAYVIVKNGRIALIGAHITPLTTASTHVHPDPTRTRPLLLHRSEISRLVGQVERAGYTLVPLNLHYSKGRVKLDVGLAKGKKQYDKRASIKEREWNREQQRLMRNRTGA